MHHLPDGPSASAIRRIELGFFQTLHSRPDFGGQRPNLIHGLLPPRRRDLGGHLEIPNRVARIHREHLLEQRRFWEYTHAHSHGQRESRSRVLQIGRRRNPGRATGNATIPPLYPAGAAPNLTGWREREMHNVVIIGSGCAGLTAAIYAGRANLRPVIIDGHEPGGQLSLTTHVENFPGFPDGILGPELIENMRKQAQKFGAEFKAGAVTEVDLHKRPFKITAGKHSYETEALIVAAGASARLLGLKGERELIGRGVSTCATCDGYFFRGKPIAVVGGGDSAM